MIKNYLIILIVFSLSTCLSKGSKEKISNDCADDGPPPFHGTIFINPEMKITDETPKSYTEGCLSIPGIQEPVERPTEVLVNAFDQEGNPFEQKYAGLMATCIQHEIDHLNGKLFIDYLSPLKRQLIRKQIKKNKSK